MPKSMSWLALNRSSHTSPTHSPSSSQSLSIPVIISEPTLSHSPGSSPGCSPVRYGSLGSGATVVRTAQDALRASLAPSPLSDPDSPSSSSSESDALSDVPPFSAFAPVLLSLPPPMPLVRLDTTTASFKTTYATLTSRPSHLSSYLASLTERKDGATPFLPAMLHLFLDRPSPPYTHILSYLRTPTTAAPALPRSASLGHHFTHERFDALLELKDEAKYLGLHELYQLCVTELQAHPFPLPPVRRPPLPPPTLVIPPLLQRTPRHDRHSSASSSSSFPHTRSATLKTPKPSSAEGWI